MGYFDKIAVSDEDMSLEKRLFYVVQHEIAHAYALKKFFGIVPKKIEIFKDGRAICFNGHDYTHNFFSKATTEEQCTQYAVQGWIGFFFDTPDSFATWINAWNSGELDSSSCADVATIHVAAHVLCKLKGLHKMEMVKTELKSDLGGYPLYSINTELLVPEEELLEEFNRFVNAAKEEAHKFALENQKEITAIAQKVVRVWGLFPRLNQSNIKALLKDVPSGQF